MEICPIDFLSENNHHLTSFLQFLKILPVGQKAKKLHQISPVFINYSH